MADIMIPCPARRGIGNGRYTILSVIGRGSLSTVYHAKDTSTKPHRDVAIKCTLTSSKSRCKLRKEDLLHQHAFFVTGGEGVVRPLHSFEENNVFCMVHEYCPRGDLFESISSSQIFLGRQDLIKPAYLKLLDSVLALHQSDIYHRDLKPENILVVSSKNSHGGEEISLRISDFGVATSNSLSHSFGLGSKRYMSPECIFGTECEFIYWYSTPASDIWALGIILINILCSRHPWEKAINTDPRYADYTRICALSHVYKTGSIDWLRDAFPVSEGVARFLDKIFRNHGKLNLEHLRDEFESINELYMTQEELSTAAEPARRNAGEFMYVPGLEPIENRVAFELSRELRFQNLLKGLTGRVIEAQLLSGLASFLASPMPSPPSDVPSRIIVCTSRSPSPVTHSSPSSSSSGSANESDTLTTPETRPIQTSNSVSNLSLVGTKEGSNPDEDKPCNTGRPELKRSDAVIALSDLLERKSEVDAGGLYM